MITSPRSPLLDGSTTDAKRHEQHRGRKSRFHEGVAQDAPRTPAVASSAKQRVARGIAEAVEDIEIENTTVRYVLNVTMIAAIRLADEQQHRCIADHAWIDGHPPTNYARIDTAQVDARIHRMPVAGGDHV